MSVILTRSKDVGCPKADVAAEFINSRIPGCRVIPYPFPVMQSACMVGMHNLNTLFLM